MADNITLEEIYSEIQSIKISMPKGHDRDLYDLVKSVSEKLDKIEKKLDQIEDAILNP
jgi:hypothetical protein